MGIIICIILAAGILANLLFTCFVSRHFDKKLNYLEDKIMDNLIEAANALDNADEILDKRIEQLETPVAKSIPIFPPIEPLDC